MDIHVWMSFAVISFIILITPGVTVTFLINQSLMHGPQVALPMSLGVVAGDGACMLASLLGMSSLIWLYPGLMTVIQIIGATYIIYLGASSFRKNSIKKQQIVTSSGKHLFKRCFWVTFFNPKAVLFFCAFLPQFIRTENRFVEYFLYLGFTFLLIAFLTSYSYAWLFGHIGSRKNISKVAKMFRFFSGTILTMLGLFAFISVFNEVLEIN